MRYTYIWKITQPLKNDIVKFSGKKMELGKKILDEVSRPRFKKKR